jgi:hypothetical protein
MANLLLSAHLLFFYWMCLGLLVFQVTLLVWPSAVDKSTDEPDTGGGSAKVTSFFGEGRAPVARQSAAEREEADLALAIGLSLQEGGACTK